MTLLLAQPFVIERHNLWTNPNGPRSSTDYIVIHHAAAVYPVGQGVQRIYNYHSKKWPDYHAAAYHEIIQIEADGLHLAAHITNEPNIVGAGVYARNENTFHICAATNFVAIPDDGFIEALAQRAAAAKRRWPKAQVVGHKDIALPQYATACPGPLWSAWQARFFARVHEILVPIPTTPTHYAYTPKLEIYQASSLSGPLAGYVLPGEQVTIDARGQPGYAANAGHLADGRGFCDLSKLESV